MRPVAAKAALPILATIMAALFLLSLAIGDVSLRPQDLIGALLDQVHPAIRLILMEIRLPRAILALVIGAGLGMAGAALQGLLRNPLADPAIIGVSGTASLGAVIAFYTGLSAFSPLALPIAAMLGAFAAVALLLGLSGRDSSILTLVLAGAALGSLATALTALVLNLAPSPFAAAEIVFWLLGSVSDRSLLEVRLAVPPILLGLIVLWRAGRGLDALTLGESVAHSLGIAVGRLRWQVVIGTALAVGAGVAVAGSIGFVGLMVPHLLRPLVDQRPGRLLPASALGGGALVLAADLLVRVIPSAHELKLGVVTSLIGAPLFFALVLKERRRGRIDA